jgi:hypothetical protein
MAKNNPFETMDEYVAALVADLRQANAERNTLRRGLQIIVDLRAGGEAEEIARAMLEEFGKIRSSSPERPINELVYPVGLASLFASHARGDLGET